MIMEYTPYDIKFLLLLFKNNEVNFLIGGVFRHVILLNKSIFLALMSNIIMEMPDQSFLFSKI